MKMENNPEITNDEIDSLAATVAARVRAKLGTAAAGSGSPPGADASIPPGSPKVKAAAEGTGPTPTDPAAAAGGGPKPSAAVLALEREVVSREVASLATESAGPAVLAMLRGLDVKIVVGDETTEIQLSDGRKLALSIEALATAGVPASLLRPVGKGGTGSSTTGNEPASFDRSPLTDSRKWEKLKPSEREAFIRKAWINS